MNFQKHLLSFRLWGPPALVAVATWIALLSSIDAAGDYPNISQGPGVAIDEVFNVQEGVRLVETLKAVALGALELRQAFGEREDLGDDSLVGYHNPDHPPFGRFWIGVSHHVTTSLFPAQHHDSEDPFVTSAARTAPATSFALLVFMIGLATSCWYGPKSGFVAAVAVVFMPRLFGHAHLAVLETFLAFTYAAATLAVAHFWNRDSPPSWKTAGVTGVVFGFVLLTKMQAIFLPLPVIVWAIWCWRTKAIIPLIIWGCASFIVFFVGWPWLWLDPFNHISEYFGRTTERASLNVWYFGEKYADRLVPWHYPLVMFLTTVPVGLHVLGFIGTFTGERPARKPCREQLVLACLLFPLLVFSLPGVPVYDGSRLFLMVFPLWAVLIGRGFMIAWQWFCSKQSTRTAVVMFGCLLALQGYGLVSLWPCHLSYYNLFVGGLRGAERLGMEPTYWGESVTRSFLSEVVEAVPQNSTIEVAPLLHQFQLDEMLTQSPILRGHGIHLRPVRPPETLERRYVLYFYRKADLSDFLFQPPEQAKLLVELKREGVQLATLYEFSGSTE